APNPGIPGAPALINRPSHSSSGETLPRLAGKTSDDTVVHEQRGVVDVISRRVAQQRDHVGAEVRRCKLAHHVRLELRARDRGFGSRQVLAELESGLADV